MESLSYVNCGVSLFVNVFLLRVIKQCGTKSLGSYCYLLFVFAANDLFFTVVHTITHPTAIQLPDAFIMYPSGIWASKVSICFFTASHSQTLILLSYHFMYRYFVLTSRGLRNPFDNKYFIVALVIIYAAYFNGWFWNNYFSFDADIEAKNFIDRTFSRNFSGSYDATIAIIYRTTHNGPIRMSRLCGLAYCNFIMAACVTIILYCSAQVIKTLRKNNSNFSAFTRRLQWQLFLVLFLQMLVPFLLIYLPCVVDINAPLFNIKLNAYVHPHLAMVAHSLFPLLDAFILLFGIGEYRRACLQFIGWNKTKAETSAYSVTSNAASRSQPTVHTLDK